MPLKPGDNFPESVKFGYVHYEGEDSELTQCGISTTYNASQEWTGKKVVLFAVPGAFTPGCQGVHLPGFIKRYQDFKSKGVDIIAVIAYDSPFVMAAWGKANKVFNKEILFLSDPGATFSKSIGWNNGTQTARYAIALDKGVVIYAGKDERGRFDNSSAETVLAKL
ncbi:peroxisomal matrix protein [Kalaharituber pfeilii]|nr:peroxisomal matrix protein [Kalaharituber pfeilii]